MLEFEKVLQQRFGLESFREGQKEIVKSVVDGNDTLVFMPTGGGKSLTYQLPGLMMDGVTIVISPLISLMKDQIDKLNSLGIRAEFINSSIGISEQRMILDQLQMDSEGKDAIKFLYIAPERLNSVEFMRIIKNIRISLVAVDEAHCISQWGHDFRPSYMKIKDFLDQLKEHQGFPVIALTATATGKVRKDIISRLGFEEHKTFTKGFDRKNIIILVKEISAKGEKMNKTLDIINKTSGSGIIYCSSRKTVDEVYDYLRENGIDAGMYTGAMTAEKREESQNRFMDGRYKVIVATNAFGMGIDKRDIRFVIHYNLPGSIENYYQEVGRAGRDGKKSYGVVLASYGDTKIQEFFIENTYPDKKEVLGLYDFLYKDFKIGEGNGSQIFKTYGAMAKESGIGNDMKVGSILKIFEKYGIINRGFEGEAEEGFHGRGVTLSQEKRKPTSILIDWNRQDLLKKEAENKLEQIKKLLFYPSCRKKFILTYFEDEEDLAGIEEGCGVCDYCIDKNKFDSGKIKDPINLSVFGIVLDTIARFNRKFGTNIMASFLQGSRDKKLIAWGLDADDNYGILSEYSDDLISAVIESLLRQGYLERTGGLFPLIGLSEKGGFALKNESALKKDEHELQSFIAMKVKGNIYAKKKKETRQDKSRSNVGDTFGESLRLFQEGLDIRGIAEARDMSTVTIEGHLIRLYEGGALSSPEISALVDVSNLRRVKEMIMNNFLNQTDKLKAIKDSLEESGFGKISYFEIKMCIAMMDKGEI